MPPPSYSPKIEEYFKLHLAGRTYQTIEVVLNIESNIHEPEENKRTAGYE
jgi:hypothetical protein